MADFIINMVSAGAHNLYRNATHMFDGMDLRNWIRIVAVVGAYLLIRPYFVNLGIKMQKEAHEKAMNEHKAKKEKEAVLSPNAFRGNVKIPEDTDTEEEKSTAADANWGKKARKRQRQMVRKILEQDEKKRREQQEDDEDKDIQEFLVD
jgi:hypothetical protein